MEHLADEFIRRRRSIVVGRGKRYPKSLRRLAVGFATQAEAAGWSASRIARHLGVASATLERWCTTPPVVEAEGGMREVVVRDDGRPADGPPAVERRAVLVTPEGYRIEGLRQEDLVELLQALRR